MPPLSFLTPENIEAIHTATLQILSETGILLTHPEARTLLDGAGATILQNKVLLPPELIESSLALCPPSFTLRGRSGNQATLGEGELPWHNLGGATQEAELDAILLAAETPIREEY